MAAPRPAPKSRADSCRANRLVVGVLCLSGYRLLRIALADCLVPSERIE